MTTLTTIALGDGLTTAPSGYGAMGLAEVYGAVDEADALATLHHVLDAGIDMVDTADLYGAGSNERLVAKVLADRRGEVTLATKFGIVPEDETYTQMGTRNDAAYVREAMTTPASSGWAPTSSTCTTCTDDRSACRSRRWWEPWPSWSPPARCATSGFPRSRPPSCAPRAPCTPSPRSRASGRCGAATSSGWSCRPPSSWASEFVPYSPLGRGFLTGTIGTDTDLSADWRGGLSRFSGDARDANLALVATLQGIADELEATQAQVALAWLRHRGTELGLPVVPDPRDPAHRAGRRKLRLTRAGTPRRRDGSTGRPGDAVVGRRSDQDDPNWVSDTRE
ncbi:MAG: aldo/keto reductase [Nocardioidaceae bacterium]